MKPVIVSADTLEVKRWKGKDTLAPYINAANEMAVGQAILLRFDDLVNVPAAKREEELKKQAKSVLVNIKKRFADKRFAYRALVDGNVAIVREA